MKFTIQLELTVDVDVTTRRISGGFITSPTYRHYWDEFTYSLKTAEKHPEDLTDLVGDDLEEFIENHLRDELQDEQQ